MHNDCFLENHVATNWMGTFCNEVLVEAKKVAWPDRKECLVTSLMVLGMSIFASVFFFLGDRVISVLLQTVLQFGL